MTKYVLLTISFLLIWLQLPAQNQSDENIRKRVEALVSGADVVIKGERIYCSKLLPEFYQSQLFTLVWNKKNQNELIAAIGMADAEGLNPDDYHLRALLDLKKEKLNAEEKAELDLLLTDAYLLYASHFLNGKVNPETVDSEWKAIRREGNPLIFLTEALKHNNIHESLSSLTPKHLGYQKLKDALLFYTSIAQKGGWQTIPSGETLKSGMTDSLRVPLLIDRLMLSGHLTNRPANGYVYSENLAAAVATFQQQNSLEADGNLGKNTLAALNTPVSQLIDQLRVNLERFRWISQELGAHYVFVNIANYQMEVYYQGVLTFREKVIVGKPFRKTPVFSSKMTYFVLNPYWTVPPTILFNDILPELKKNPEYLSTKNIRVFSGYGSNATELAANTINWSSLSKGNFPYVLRQDPGPTNALGVVKFMFPNTYNIYIHDTPSKELFNRQDRTFSSGCIRLNNPLSFARYLIKNDPAWTESQLEKALETGKEKTIMLRHPLHVHILYLTAWAENDAVYFSKDPYLRDQAVLLALNQSAPGI